MIKLESVSNAAELFETATPVKREGPALSYKDMGAHPEGGTFTSFETDADALAAWQRLGYQEDERHQLIKQAPGQDAMIRVQCPPSPVE